MRTLRYSINQVKNEEFYKMPKFLFINQFTNLSNDARVLYTLLKDRHQLSVLNNWIDENGNVYLIYTRKDMMDMLGKSGNTVLKLMNELKKYGLLEEERQGLNNPNLIYLLMVNFNNKQEKTQKKPINTGYSNIEIPETQNVSIRNSKNLDSRSSKKEYQEPQNMRPNNTDINNTDINNTNSINQSKKVVIKVSDKEKFINISKKEIDGLKTLNYFNFEFREQVFNEMWESKSLPYSFMFEDNKLDAAIKIMTDYESYGNKRSYEGDPIQYSAYCLFVEALTEMLNSSSKNMKLKGAIVTYSKVYDKLLQYIRFEKSYSNNTQFITIYEVQEQVIADYISACGKSDISNHLQYMKACVWNVLQIGNITIDAKIYQHFGNKKIKKDEVEK